MNLTGLEGNTYAVAATCSNCGHKGQVVRPKGEKMPSIETCPNCGCYEFVVKKYFG